MRRPSYEHLVQDVLGEGVWRDLGEPLGGRGGTRDIEISGISSFVVDGNFPWNLIVVQTDAEVYGVGEAFTGPVREHIKFLETALIDHNPIDVARNVEHMNQVLSGIGGSTGYAQAAVSGIEIALWDIAGKLLEVPVYQLLGGKFRDTVEVYKDCHAGEPLLAASAGDGASMYGPEQYQAVAEQTLDEGFSSMKFDLDVGSSSNDTTHRRLSGSEVDQRVEIVRAVTEAVGDEAEVGFDLHWNFSVETALEIARAIESFEVGWLEDPVPPESVESHRRVARGTSTRILAGENLTRLEGFLPYITEYTVDFLAPDIQKCGGLLEFQQIASLADVFGIPLAPHNISSPVGTIASVHAAATVPNVFALEWHASEVDWWDDVHVGPPLIDDGRIAVPEEPGLGITLDRSVLDDHCSPRESIPF